jgi:hypothetical protein
LLRRHSTRAQRQRFHSAHARALLMLRGRSARGRLGMAPARHGTGPTPASGRAQGGAAVRPMPSVRMLVPVDGSILRTRESQVVFSLRLDAL